MVKVKNQPRKAPQNDDLPAQGGGQYSEPSSLGLVSGADMGMQTAGAAAQTSHHEAHAAAHIRHIKDELLRRIQAAFADQASLFDGEGELGPMPSAATQPPYQANSAAASPPGSQQRGHPAACTPPTSRHPSASQSHATPGADDASLFDNLPPLDEVATPGPLLSGPRSAAHAAASTSIPTNGHPGHPSVQPPPHGNGRANGTAFVSPGQGASVELAQHGAAPSDTGGSMDMEIDILAPSPPVAAHASFRATEAAAATKQLDHKDSNKVTDMHHVTPVHKHSPLSTQQQHHAHQQQQHDADSSLPPIGPVAGGVDGVDGLQQRHSAVVSSAPPPPVAVHQNTPEPSNAAVQPQAVWKQLLQRQAVLAADAASSLASDLQHEIVQLRERLNDEIRSRRGVEQQLHDAHHACTQLRTQLRAANHAAADAAGHAQTAAAAAAQRRAPQAPVSQLRLQADEVERRLVKSVALQEQTTGRMNEVMEAVRGALAVPLANGDGLEGEEEEGHGVGAAEGAPRGDGGAGGAGGGGQGEIKDKDAVDTNTTATNNNSNHENTTTTTPTMMSMVSDVRTELRAVVKGGKSVDLLVKRIVRGLAAIQAENIPWTQQLQDLVARARQEHHTTIAANQALAAHTSQLEGDIAAMCGLAAAPPSQAAYAIAPQSAAQGPGGVWMVRPPPMPRGGRGGRGRQGGMGGRTGGMGRRAPGQLQQQPRRPKIIQIGGFDQHGRVRPMTPPDGVMAWRGGYAPQRRRSEDEEEDEDGRARARRRQRVDYRALDAGMHGIDDGLEGGGLLQEQRQRPGGVGGGNGSSGNNNRTSPSGGGRQLW